MQTWQCRHIPLRLTPKLSRKNDMIHYFHHKLELSNAHLSLLLFSHNYFLWVQKLMILLGLIMFHLFYHSIHVFIKSPELRKLPLSRNICKYTFYIIYLYIPFLINIIILNETFLSMNYNLHFYQDDIIMLNFCIIS